MANGKKSVVMYCDLIHTVNKLTDEQAGKLFKHYLAYVNDLNPVCSDILIEVAFEPIKQSLKRDLDKWEDKKDERSYSGRLGNLKRWHSDLHERVEKEEIDLEEAEKIAKNRKTSLSDNSESLSSQTVANVAVSVSDSVSDSVIYSFDDFWDQYDKKVDRSKCEKKFGKLKPKDKIAIKDTLSVYIQSTPEVQYRKNPLTYLNGECWKDEVSIQNKPTERTHNYKLFKQ